MLPSSALTPAAEPVDSPTRLAAVEELQLTGHDDDLHLEAAVRTLAAACRVPMAVVNLVTPGRQTYPAEVGVGQPCTTVPDDVSFCAEVVGLGRLVQVRDATEHPRYAANPLVLAGQVRSYAGHPLRSGGHVIGALSVFDARPRLFDERELEILAHQAHLVEAVLSLRRVSMPAPVSELQGALDRQELVLHYQPVVDLRTGQVRGVEALVRWQHPELGLLPPAAFIPDAERSGLILPLGVQVLREACEQAARWHRAGRDLTVSVNLSPQQLAVPSFERVVADLLAEAGAPPDRLVLEITESSVMDQPSAPETLDRLRALGVRLALDDFGTGYSSLSYLRRFCVDTIKIDRSFVAGLGRNPDDDAIVASVVSLAARVDKAVVAEGVETEQQADALRALGVPSAQGFLWSRALPVDALEAWMSRRLEVAVPAPRPAVRRPAPQPVDDGSSARQIQQMHAAGASLHTIAAALNASGSRTSSGLRWHSRTVAAVLAAGAVR